MPSDDLPEEVKERAEAIKRENPDLSESEAIAIARDQLNLASDDDCPDGHTKVGGECVPIPESTHVDAPPSILSTPQHLTLKSLETEPIERVEEDDNTVRYKSLKLLSPGVWSDAGSQTATYYPPEGIGNLEAHYDESEHDGPPVNIMHDLDMDTFEAHEASVAGHVDPDTLDQDDDGNLYGDLVLDTETGAGQFADENLQSTLENEGTVGFGGPSVEIPAEGLVQEHDDVRDMPRVDGGRLSGLGLVMDPASKSVNFAREAARRPVAMSASGESGKVLTRQNEGMSQSKTLADPDDVRSDLEQYNVDTEGMSDEDVMEFAEALHDDLMDTLEMEGDDEEDEDDDEEEEGVEAEDDDPEEDEEDDEETEMQDGEDVEAMREQLANLSSRLEDVEDALSQAMTADDVDAELEDAAGNKLADADTVAELEEAREELDRRLEALEEQPGESKTLADNDSDVDWSDADSGIDYDPATGSMSR